MGMKVGEKSIKHDGGVQGGEWYQENSYSQNRNSCSLFDFVWKESAIFTLDVFLFCS